MNSSPLIRSGNWNQFTAKATVSLDKQAKHPSLESLRTLNDLENATRDVQPLSVTLQRSSGTRGLCLKSLKLTKGFEGFLQNPFNKENEIYFVSWAWDLGGETPFLHPTAGTDPESVIIPLKVGDLREFLGAGINLFPARTVVGGLAVRMMIWESDAKSRKFGETLQMVAKEIQGSELTNLLSLISTLGSVPLATVNAVFTASTELAKVIGIILKNNSNDYVDYYEGYYPVEQSWASGEETHKGTGTEICLQRIAG